MWRKGSEVPNGAFGCCEYRCSLMADVTLSFDLLDRVGYTSV